jgi:succinate dehydrogenase/fumarate reductase flavoprotein subunit
MRLDQVERWDIEADVVVIGFGAAGGVTAIEAADAGAYTVILEKMTFPGGLSIVSAGGIRVSQSANEALLYLKATCGGRTPDDMLEILATGMTQIPDYLRRLARLSDATVVVTPALGNYPFPGCESLAYCEISRVPALEDGQRYHATYRTTNGGRLFKVLEDNIAGRGIPVHYGMAATRLIVAADGEVRGVAAEKSGRTVCVRAAKAVVLTCGGFENDEEMKQQYLQAKPVLNGAFAGNTGDGIRMAQAVGADLWHMWHYHGPYALKDSTGDYPFAVFPKVLPMWTPGHPGKVSDLGVADDTGAPMSKKTLAQMAWIAVDQDGRRFMDEYPPYWGDTGVRPFDFYDSKQQKFPRIPAFMIFDENGRMKYAMTQVFYNDADAAFALSPDNLEAVERGIFGKADTVEELAAAIGVSPRRLRQTIDEWNAAVRDGFDPEFRRQPDTMVPVNTPPYYFGEIYPTVINTQGGPRHNVRQEIVDPFGCAIPRLYAAGECGSVFGHLYMGGGNLTECVVGGWIAGRQAAKRSAWNF